VPFDNLFDNCQTQAASGVAALARRTVESFEYTLHVGGSDAAPSIRDLESHGIAAHMR